LTRIDPLVALRYEEFAAALTTVRIKARYFDEHP